ncbi:hypothetical protein BGX26_000768 [Mortierella sp. AD094]|nr:hypothetical protein BGX26_000768 [Mortierella sp. AD094]
MYYYHLKLDLYANNTTHSSERPQQQQQQQQQQSIHLGSKESARSTPQATSVLQATRFRAILNPFPQQQSHQNRTPDLPFSTEHQHQDNSTAPTALVNKSEQVSIIPSSPPVDYRLGPIHIACLDEPSLVPTKDKSGTHKNRASKHKKAATATASSTMGTTGATTALASAGFHDSESAEGILRLYKDTNEITTGNIYIQSGQEGDQTSTSTITVNDREREGAQIIHPDHGTTVCVLAVPSYLSPGDFLSFVGPVRSNVSHFRIIRDAVPNRFMVLMKFRTSEATAEFYRRYNGKTFSSLEPEICHVVYLKSIEIRAGSMPPYAFPFINDDPFLQNNHPTSPTAGVPASTITNMRDSPEGGSENPGADTGQLANQLSTLSTTDHPGLAELPTCPVCLERMDSSVTGLLTILCQHTFHCHCLSKWGEGSCPVCRYSQKSVRKITTGSELESTHPGGVIASTDGITEDQNVCALCGTTENLWICLICGHIGCGRYQEKHAYHHYYETSHLYALELETQRVWDYAGDGYVHRLIQNKADGKLVELPSAMDGTLPSQHSVQVGQEKLDAIGLEYTYLLTSQLESQRLYFDAQMAAMTAQLAQVNKEAKEWEKEAALLNQKNRELALMAESLEKEKLPMLIKEKKAAEKRLEKMQEKLQQLERQYEEEKEMNVGLRTNQDSFKIRLQEKEAEIQELQEQVRDMMIYLDTQQKVEASPMKDELVNGTIGVVAPPASSSPSPSGGHTRRKGGRK